MFDKDSRQLGILVQLETSSQEPPRPPLSCLIDEACKMDHQGEVQSLNIKISLQYVNGIRNTAYPDFRLIARDVETYLGKYPNKTDYWEVVNKGLTQLILDKYPGVSRAASEIEVSASPLIPYVRASIATRLSRKS